MVTNERTNDDEQPGESRASLLVNSEQSWLLQYTAGKDDGISRPESLQGANEVTAGVQRLKSAGP